MGRKVLRLTQLRQAAVAVVLAGLLASCGISHGTVSPPSSSSSTFRPPTRPTSSSAVTTDQAVPVPSTTTPGLVETTTGSTTSNSPSPSSSLVLNTQPPLPAGPAPTAEPGLDMANPNVVAEAAVRTLWTVNVVKDETPYAAEVRATAYMTPPYAAQIRANPPVAAPGAQWQLWYEHHVVTTVRLVPEHDSGAPLSSATTAYEEYWVTITPHGNHGWTSVPNTLVEFVVLTRSGLSSPWLVSDVNTTPSATSHSPWPDQGGPGQKAGPRGLRACNRRIEPPAGPVIYHSLSPTQLVICSYLRLGKRVVYRCLPNRHTSRATAWSPRSWSAATACSPGPGRPWCPGRRTQTSTKRCSGSGAWARPW